MSDYHLQKEVFQTVLLGNGIVYVKPTRSVTIEEDMAKEMLETCFMNMEHPDQNTGLIINMSRVAFVSEAARNLLSGDSCIGQSITHLGLVSNSHLSNVISTLTIQHSNSDEVDMRLFKSAEDAVDWLQDHMDCEQLLEAAG